MARPATVPRDEVLELVRGLPEQIDVEDLIVRLYLREKLAAADRAVAEGRTLSVEEVRAQAAEWRRP